MDTCCDVKNEKKILLNSFRHFLRFLKKQIILWIRAVT